MRPLRIGGIRQHPVVAVTFDALRGLLLHDGFDLAASIAFSSLLALLPFLVFLFALGGLVGGQEALDILVAFLFRLVPVEVARTLTPAIVDVVTEPPSGLVPVSLLFAIWVAASALDALRLSLNHAYNIVERRWIWQLKLQSIVFVMFGGCFLVTIAFLILLGPFLWHVAEGVLHLPVENKAFLIFGQYAVGAVLISFGSALLHLLLPMHRLQLREVLPGSIATSVLWMIAAVLFTLYLSRLANYGATYGTLAGFVVTLVFFYISAAIFIYGAEFNASVARWRIGNIPRQVTSGEVRPLQKEEPPGKPLSARTASPVRWEMGDGAAISAEALKLRRLEHENLRLRKALTLLTSGKETTRKVVGKRRQWQRENENR
jgi:membrane protein